MLITEECTRTSNKRYIAEHRLTHPIDATYSFRRHAILEDIFEVQIPIYPMLMCTSYIIVSINSIL